MHPRTLLTTGLILLLASTAHAQLRASIEFGGAALDLDDEVAARFEDLQIDLASTGSRAALALGWSWSDQLTLELGLGGGPLATGDPEIDAALGVLALELIVPLRPNERVAPYLAGHLGGAVLSLDGDARRLGGGAMGVGTGVEIRVARHWAFDFGYRFSVVDFERERVDGRELDLDGSGRVQRWGVRTVWRF